MSRKGVFVVISIAVSYQLPIRYQWKSSMRIRSRDGGWHANLSVFDALEWSVCASVLDFVLKRTLILWLFYIFALLTDNFRVENVHIFQLISVNYDG